MSTFLSLKWHRTRIIFLSDVASDLIFLCFLTVYILFSELYNTVNDGGAASNTTDPFSFNDSSITSGKNDSNCTSETYNIIVHFLWWILIVCLPWWVVIVYLAGLFSRVLGQVILHRWVYLKSLETWLDISLIIATFITCFGVVESAEVILHSSAVALFLGWTKFFMLSSRLPLLSVQHETLRTFCRTFIKYMARYVILLIAFALSVYILFKGRSEEGGAEMFTNLFVSLRKAFVMFTGEFEVYNLPFDTVLYTSHVIFFLFVLLMGIVLLNLLKGLAVNDTGERRRNAETRILAARVKLISRTEREEFCFRSEPKEARLVIYPNRGNRIGSAAVRSLLNIISKKMGANEKEELTAVQEK
jgi:transient receptor potential cation channel subfamily A protein 1